MANEAYTSCGFITTPSPHIYFGRNESVEGKPRLPRFRIPFRLKYTNRLHLPCEGGRVHNSPSCNTSAWRIVYCPEGFPVNVYVFIPYQVLAKNREYTFLKLKW
jgi:hypothetical protein